MRSSKRIGERHNEPPHWRPVDLTQAREMFWQNVTRELLTSMAMQRSKLAAEVERQRRELVRQGKDDPGPIKDLPGFDGRVAVVTQAGDRIPIADITPLFACSINDSLLGRALSEDVQCTVFQIRTPSGEVYTFPVQEIRAVHALSEETMQALKEQARARQRREDSDAPFGFAAFTSLARELEAGAQDSGSEAPDDGAPADADTRDPADPSRFD